MAMGYTTSCVGCGKLRDKNSMDKSYCLQCNYSPLNGSYHHRDERWEGIDCPHCLSVHLIPPVGLFKELDNYYKCFVTELNVRDKPQCKRVSRVSDEISIAAAAKKLNLKLW